MQPRRCHVDCRLVRTQHGRLWWTKEPYDQVTGSFAMRGTCRLLHGPDQFELSPACEPTIATHADNLQLAGSCVLWTKAGGGAWLRRQQRSCDCSASSSAASWPAWRRRRPVRRRRMQTPWRPRGGGRPRQRRPHLRRLRRCWVTMRPRSAENFTCMTHLLPLQHGSQHGPKGMRLWLVTFDQRHRLAEGPCCMWQAGWQGGTAHRVTSALVLVTTS